MDLIVLKGRGSIFDILILVSFEIQLWITQKLIPSYKKTDYFVFEKLHQRNWKLKAI